MILTCTRHHFKDIDYSSRHEIITEESVFDRSPETLTLTSTPLFQLYMLSFLYS